MFLLINVPVKLHHIRDVLPQWDYIKVWYHIMGSNDSNSIVALALTTAPLWHPVRINASLSVVVLLSAFHNISVWKLLLNVTFIPEMNGWFMVVWQTTREKGKKGKGEGGGLNTPILLNTRVVHSFIWKSESSIFTERGGKNDISCCAVEEAAIKLIPWRQQQAGLSLCQTKWNSI